MAIGWAAPARAADPDDDSIILVAKRQLQDQLYGSTILLARPIGGDRHVGFIINKPTQMTLGKLFPKHEPSQKVSDPVFLGGPVSPEVIFAMVQGQQSPGGRSMRSCRTSTWRSTAEVVDQIIEKHPRRRASSPAW